MERTQPFLEAARGMAHAIAALGPTRWFIDCDTDADGLCAAAVMTRALGRIGHRVLVRPSRDKHAEHYDMLAQAPGDALLLLDKGSSHIDRMPAGRPVFVVDHHNVLAETPPGVRMLNPRSEGLDGSRDASASTTAAALALALVGPDALSMAPVALSGAVGDWQHRPAWAGWNKQLLEQALQSGSLSTRRRPHLVGVDLEDAAMRRGLPPGAVASLGLDPSQDESDLDEEEASRIVSASALAALARGATAGAVRRLVVDEHYDVRLAASLRSVFRITDACGRLGHPATGLAYLLGDPTATSEAYGHFATYRAMLRAALDALPDAVQDGGGIRFAWTSDAALTGMVAGLALESGLVDRARPLCVLAARDDGKVQVSTRALAEHVEAGVDLGACTGAAAAAVGAEGGGHPVAAGAVIPQGTADAFLERLSSLVEATAPASRQT